MVRVPLRAMLGRQVAAVKAAVWVVVVGEGKPQVDDGSVETPPEDGGMAESGARGGGPVGDEVP